MHTSDKTKEWILAHGSEEMNHTVQTDANTLLSRRTTRTPLAYITGKKQFYGRDFVVSEAVLIPRPESEVIIEIFSGLVHRGEIPADSEVFDIGTGSGCLAVSLKAEFPEHKVSAVDISNAALKIATINAKLHGTDVAFIQSDLLENVSIAEDDSLIANLPYVPESLITSQEILAEPKLALFAGNDGLDIYKKFWQQITTLHVKPLFVITESLTSQHGNMSDIATEAGFECLQIEDLIQVFKRT